MSIFFNDHLAVNGQFEGEYDEMKRKLEMCGEGVFNGMIRFNRFLFK